MGLQDAVAAGMRLLSGIRLNNMVVHFLLISLGMYLVGQLNLVIIILAFCYVSYRRTLKFVEMKHATNIVANEPRKLAMLLSSYNMIPSYLLHSEQVESVRWLNAAVKSMWPCFREGLRLNAMQKLEPILSQEQLPPYLKEIRLKSFDLGESPLLFTGAKFNPDHRNKDDFILDLEVKFAGDTNIVFDVVTKTVWTTVKLEGVQLTGSLRIRLKDFVPIMPCFKRAEICFIKPPDLDFSLSMCGVNVMNIPALNSYLYILVKETLMDVMIFPNVVEYKLWNFENARIADLRKELARAHIDLNNQKFNYRCSKERGQRLQQEVSKLKQEKAELLKRDEPDVEEDWKTWMEAQPTEDNVLDGGPEPDDELHDGPIQQTTSLQKLMDIASDSDSDSLPSVDSFDPLPSPYDEEPKIERKRSNSLPSLFATTRDAFFDSSRTSSDPLPGTDGGPLLGSGSGRHLEDFESLRKELADVSYDRSGYENSVAGGRTRIRPRSLSEELKVDLVGLQDFMSSPRYKAQSISSKRLISSESSRTSLSHLSVDGGVSERKTRKRDKIRRKSHDLLTSVKNISGKASSKLKRTGSMPVDMLESIAIKSGTLKRKSTNFGAVKKWKDIKAAVYAKKLYLWSEGQRKAQREIDLSKSVIHKVGGSATPKFKVVSGLHSYDFQASSFVEMDNWTSVMEQQCGNQ